MVFRTSSFLLFSSSISFLLLLLYIFFFFPSFTHTSSICPSFLLLIFNFFCSSFPLTLFFVILSSFPLFFFSAFFLLWFISSFLTFVFFFLGHFFAGSKIWKMLSLYWWNMMLMRCLHDNALFMHLRIIRRIIFEWQKGIHFYINVLMNFFSYRILLILYLYTVNLKKNYFYFHYFCYLHFIFETAS